MAHFTSAIEFNPGMAALHAKRAKCFLLQYYSREKFSFYFREKQSHFNEFLQCAFEVEQAKRCDSRL